MNELDVRLACGPAAGPESPRPVGRLAWRDGRSYFEYDPAFLEDPLPLSPFKLPVRPGLIEHRDHAFGPLPGVFDDSLPDGWGLLLMDRELQQRGVDPRTLNPLDRLHHLGRRTMGALTYHPPADVRSNDPSDLHLAELAANAADVQAGDAAELLPQLARAGGSPGGARPKVLVGVHGDRLVSGDDTLPPDHTPWLVKFRGNGDDLHTGRIEYACSLMARAAGIPMPDTRLFPARIGRRTEHFFGVARFDRGPLGERRHMHTLANLIHANFRVPSLDYTDLLKVTSTLTRHHADVVAAFRQMVFNVAINNRDDHAKNFAFVLAPNDPNAGWRLTPAYDIVPAPGPGGEHSTTVAGEGHSPNRDHCHRVAEAAGVRVAEADAAIDAVNTAVRNWPAYADDAGCPAAVSRRVAAELRVI